MMNSCRHANKKNRTRNRKRKRAIIVRNLGKGDNGDNAGNEPFLAGGSLGEMNQRVGGISMLGRTRPLNKGSGRGIALGDKV